MKVVLNKSETETVESFSVNSKFVKFSENKNLENRVASTAYYLHLFVLLNLFLTKIGISSLYTCVFVSFWKNVFTEEAINLGRSNSERNDLFLNFKSLCSGFSPHDLRNGSYPLN